MVISRDFSAFNWLCFVLWTPLGLAAFVIRLVLVLLFLALMLVASSCGCLSEEPGRSNRGCNAYHSAITLFHWIWMTSTVLNPEEVNNAEGGQRDAPAAVIVSNHISEQDWVPIAARFSIRVLAMDHLRRVPVIGQALKLANPVYIGQVGNAQSAGAALTDDDVKEFKQAQRQKVLAAVTAATDGKSLLVFPEGVLTNGRTAILKYQKFVFGLGVPVQPLAIRRRPTLLQRCIPVSPVSPAEPFRPRSFDA